MMGNLQFDFTTKRIVVYRREIEQSFSVKVDSRYIQDFSLQTWTLEHPTSRTTEFMADIVGIGKVSMAHFALDLNPYMVDVKLSHPKKDYRVASINKFGLSQTPRINTVTPFKGIRFDVDNNELEFFYLHGRDPLTQVLTKVPRVILANTYNPNAINLVLWPYYIEAAKQDDAWALKQNPPLPVHLLSSAGIREAL
jgi:hypothetical protein